MYKCIERIVKSTLPDGPCPWVPIAKTVNSANFNTSILQILRHITDYLFVTMKVPHYSLYSEQ